MMLTSNYYSVAVVDDIVFFLCQHLVAPQLSLHVSIFEQRESQLGRRRSSRARRSPGFFSAVHIAVDPAAARNVKSDGLPLVTWCG